MMGRGWEGCVVFDVKSLNNDVCGVLGCRIFIPCLAL